VPGTQNRDFYKIKAAIEPGNAATTGAWVDMVANVPADFDAVFDDPDHAVFDEPDTDVYQTTFTELHVDKIKVTVLAYCKDDATPETYAIEGYFDDVQLVMGESGTILNGGFENRRAGWSISDHPAGWTGEVVTMDESGHPATDEGSKSLYASETGITGHTFRWNQSRLDVSGQWYVEAASYLTSYTDNSFTGIKIEGYSNSTKKVQAVYWRGSNCGEHPTGIPTAEPNNYYKLRTATEPANEATTAAWVDMTANGPADFDAEFDKESYGDDRTTFAALGIDTIKLTVEFWCEADPAQIEGYFDDVQLVILPVGTCIIIQ